MIKRAVHQEFLEFLSDHALGMEIHRKVRISPIAGDAKTLEFLTLDIHPAFGKLAAFLTEVHDIYVVLIAAFGAVLFFDLPFDRQTMTIPAGNITGVAAHHLLAAHNHIFQDLVQRMANVQMAIRIWRAIVQREWLAALGLFAQAVVDTYLRPAL